MTTTSNTKSGSLVTSTIKVNGSTIPGTIQIYSISVKKSVNHIGRAELVILDGSASSETFPVSSSNTFIPGNKITIEAGYDSDNNVIFSGLITKQSIRIDNEIGSALEVECQDEAVRMTVGRKNTSFKNTTDQNAIQSLIGNYGALQADVATTSPSLPLLQQYYTTDWDFILARAEVNSLLVNTINGKVSVFSPTEDTGSVLTIEYGDNLYSLNADLNSLTQYAKVKASAWDYQAQEVGSAHAKNFIKGPGNISSKKLSDVVGLSDFELQTTAPLDSENLANWAKAQMLKSELSKIIGEVQFQGNSVPEPGHYITLAGTGDRFNGDHFVASVDHDISDGNWVTIAEFGLSSTWSAQENDVTAPSASGLLPGVHGLFNARVKQIFDDPDSEFRILVDLPLFDSSGDGLWARLTNFYSTSGAGAFFLPEVGDEVIVGFLNDDPRHPVILGSLYSSSRKPFSEFDPNEENSLKAIVSKSELRVLFDDEKKILSFITPGGNQVVLDDENGQISINDENKNSIVMSGGGITIRSPKSVNIEANQDVKVSGATGVTVDSSGGDIKTTALNISETARSQYSAKGNATASVQAEGELSLKGAMVMIN